MRRGLILLAIACISFSYAKESFEESGAVSSTHATYDGNALILTGHVVLDHSLGKMTAEEASLQKQEVGKDFPFSVIALRNDVHLALKSSAELLCETADLDFGALKGFLFAKEGQKVIYSDTFKKGKAPLPFKLSGNSVELLFFKDPSDEKKSTYDIETVLLKEEVIIDYAQSFHLQADHALYRKQTLCSDQKEFQGVITAYPKDQNTQCHLTHGEDAIDADSVDFDMGLSQLSLLHPKGILHTCFFPKVQKEPMRIAADHLTWDYLHNILSLNGHVHTVEESLGELSSSETLQLVLDSVKGKHALKAIHAQGPTTLTYRDPALHKLISYGRADIDRDKLLATLESPEIEGRVPLDKQIYYEEDQIGVFADKADLEYSDSENFLRPICLQLKGNVRLFSHDPKQPPRCGIADRLNYSLTTRTLILSANPGNKVLFWDESQNMRMSASEVHITYDLDSAHHSIKGIGNVRLTLTPEEQQHLKQLFPHYKVAYE